MILSHSKPKHINNLKTKLGHGGTLDPLATGVLIVGIGKGTKSLQRFLECTKTYECVVLFGAATDSYDAVGKVVSRKPYEHVTRELVEEKLAQFRGKIMQKPSVFSALKVDGKKMYEYAREGGNIPEVPARPVEVEELELVEWLAPGSHEYSWPDEEVDSTEKVGAEKLIGIRKDDAEVKANRDKSKQSKKRSRSRSPNDLVSNAESHPKKPKTDSEPAMSGALPSEENQIENEPEEPVTNSEAHSKLPKTESEPAMSGALRTENDSAPEEEASAQPTESTENASKEEPTSKSSPPAARLRMTVTSGFYVRSLCHDLGIACDSLGLMSSLIRSRQGDYELNKNTLEYSDLEAGPKTWEPKLQAQLEGFMEKEGWELEEVMDEEEWESSKNELARERRYDDRERSYRSGRGARKRNGRGGKSWQKR